MRILATCVIVEGFIRPSLGSALRWLGLSSTFWSGAVLAIAMMVLAVGVTWCWTRIPFDQIGIYRCKRWTSAEKWFFLQALALGIMTFTAARWSALGILPLRPAWIQTTAIVFVWQMFWGFYQEYIYRGMLQTELVRRWGAVTGILVGNLFFTFGPLHAYHFWIAVDKPAHLWFFTGIFAIGLYFGVLFHRSGNLSMIGVLHGVGDFFIDGLEKIR